MGLEFQIKVRLLGPGKQMMEDIDPQLDKRQIVRVPWLQGYRRSTVASLWTRGA